MIDVYMFGCELTVTVGRGGAMHRDRPTGGTEVGERFVDGQLGVRVVPPAAGVPPRPADKTPQLLKVSRVIDEPLERRAELVDLLEGDVAGAAGHVGVAVPVAELHFRQGIQGRVELVHLRLGHGPAKHDELHM